MLDLMWYIRKTFWKELQRGFLMKKQLLEDQSSTSFLIFAVGQMFFLQSFSSSPNFKS